MLKLSDEFISQYVNQEPPMTPLGEFVYYRTYSRFLPEENRREYWWETVRRAVEYNCSIIKTSVEEAEKLYDNIFNLRQFLSGRTLWVGGTESSLRFPMSNFNCFIRSTNFITRQGIKSFNDFEDGDKVDILSSTGGWKTATVKNFGKCNITELVVKRGKREEKIYTTYNHRWYVRKNKSEKKYMLKTTEELKHGDVLRDKRRYEQTDIVPCSIGIQHGIVFGDGTYDKKMNHCRVHLVDDKQELSKYFTTGSKCSAGEYNQTVVYGLPNNWKNLPPLDSNVEYLMGFIMGLFSTDGSYSDNLCIGSSSEETLKHIKSILSILGIDCGEVSLNREISPFDGSYSPLYRLNLYTYYIPKTFFIREKHISKFKSREHEPIELLWTVKEVNPIVDSEQDVWCVIEPETESFTLANNILTKNCSFTAIDSIESYCDMFYLLMLGSGVGFNVSKEYINKLPKFRNDTIVNHKPYHPVPKDKRQEDTTLEINKYFAMLTIGDSKEGWVEALRIFLHVFSINTTTSSEYRYNIKQLVINYNNIRQKGERLKTFGGISSGYENLMLMFMKIYNLLLQKKEDSFNLSSLDCLDIANMLAENVVSGGIRRSSGLCLFDINDTEVMNAKNNIFVQDSDGNWILNRNLEHRTKSNNSIGFTKKPTKEKLEEIFKSIRHSGEPGFINLENAKRRFENSKGVNPCGEVLLDNRGMCNLVTINIFGFIQDGELQLEKLLEACALNVRASYRMACLDMELPEWNKVQKEHMLLGCSITGWQDAMSTLNYSVDDQREILKKMREVMHIEAEKYAVGLSKKVPKLVTTVKPEGTLSLLPTVSAGVHHSYAPYYIRRVRISSGDPLVKVLEELGYNVIPEVGQDDKNCNTKVVEFYAKAPVKVTRNDISAIEQLETYKMFMDNYVDHNASNTITVKSDEWEDVIDWVYTNWDGIVGVTFLASDDSYYPLMPYEETTQEIYEQNTHKQRITPELISKYEKVEIEHDIDSGGECSGGSCPIR